MDFEKDVAIDKFNLDLEWEKQPAIFERYAKANAEAVADRDRIWQERKVARAELMLEILTSHKEAGTKKPTDAAIDAEIRTNPKHQEVSERLINADEEVGLTESGKWAMPQRRDALENLTTLFLTGYWADQPKKRKEAKYVVNEKVDKETTIRLKRKLRRKTEE